MSLQQEIDLGTLPGQVPTLSLVEHLRAEVASWGEEPAGQLARLHGRLSASEEESP